MYGAKYLPPLVRQPLPIGQSVTSIGVRTYRNMQGNCVMLHSTCRRMHVTVRIQEAVSCLSAIVQCDSFDQDDCRLIPIVSTSLSSHIILPNFNSIVTHCQQRILSPPLLLSLSFSPILSLSSSLMFPPSPSLSLSPPPPYPPIFPHISLSCIHHVQWATWCNAV